ncbi:hypothetical protein MUK42_35563 [Musa troglodytarum]|uniref:Uncharacterized protein n=1 Tax=Musa troglodytarum TaxID=320322 RepID=A0A9E7FHA5_9LILI|nr:hypothetical protein MUK42_35563 [Musa troglodytarum]
MRIGRRTAPLLLMPSPLWRCHAWRGFAPEISCSNEPEKMEDRRLGPNPSSFGAGAVGGFDEGRRIFFRELTAGSG